MNSEFGQFFSGYYYHKRNDKQGEYFQYELLESPSRVFGTIINNLIAEQGRMTIKTNWAMGFKPKEYITDYLGRKWQIVSVVKMLQETNPQVMALCLENQDTDYVLSLVEVDNVENIT